MAKSHKAIKTTAAALVAASAVVPAAVSAAEINDIDTVADYAKDAVKYLSEQGYLQGNENGNFNPTNSIDRASAAEVLRKALELPVEGTEDFSDVDSSDWFYDAVRAASPEVFEGNESGQFLPNKVLTRQEAAKAIVDGFGLTGAAEISFDDNNEIDGWAKEYVEIAYNNEIINGKPGNLFAPTDEISRAEFAVMVKRAVDATSELTSGVEGVDAVNATEIVINFDQPVGNAAKLVESYTIVNKADFNKQAPSAVKLSEDMKSVTLTVASLSDDTNYLVRFNNMTDASEETIELGDVDFTTDFPDEEPTVASSQVEVLRNGDDSADVTELLAVNLPEGFTLSSSSTNVDVLDSEEASVLGADNSSVAVNSSNQVIINLGDNAGTEVELKTDDTYTITFAAGSLTNEYNVSNKKEITVDFVATEAVEVVPQIIDYALTTNDAGNKVIVTVTTDIPVNVANETTVANLTDDEGNIIALETTAAIAAETEFTIEGNITSGNIQSGKQYPVTFLGDKVESVLGVANEAIVGANISGVDTTAPVLEAAAINSASQVVFAFDENINLVDEYSITFAGITFDGEDGNVATVAGNTLTLTSEDKGIPTAVPTSGLVFNVVGQVENAAGVDALYNDTLLADDEDAKNDSTDQSFLIDNAVATFVDATISGTTVTLTFSEDVTDVNNDVDEEVSILVNGDEYVLDLAGNGSTYTVTVADDVEAGDELYIAPNSIKSVSDDKVLSVINTVLGE